MKLRIMGIFLLLLSGCAHSIEKGDSENIALGMSQNQVIEILGEPDYSTTNRNELSNDFYSWYSIHAFEAEDEESSYDEGEAYLSLSNFLEAIEGKKNVEAFEYKVENEFLMHVYFLDNEVSYFYEYEL